MTITIEPLAAAGIDAVQAFVDTLATRDRTFLEAGLDEPGGVGRWLEGGDGDQRFAAADAGAVAGCLSLHPGHDWRRHVAEVRIVVHPDHRRHGVATALARHAVITAATSGIEKLFVNVIATEEGTTAMFGALGFEAEGLLRNHVRGDAGETHDLLVLAHFVDEMMESMGAVGLDGAVADQS